MQKFTTDDFATLIGFYVMTPETAIKTDFQAIVVNPKVPVIEVNKRGIKLHPRDISPSLTYAQIGTPIRNKANNSYLIVVPKGEDPKAYIEKAKAMMRDAIAQTTRDLQTAMNNADTALKNEPQWLYSTLPD